MAVRHRAPLLDRARNGHARPRRDKPAGEYVGGTRTGSKWPLWIFKAQRQLHPAIGLAQVRLLIKAVWRTEVVIPINLPLLAQFREPLIEPIRRHLLKTCLDVRGILGEAV